MLWVWAEGSGGLSLWPSPAFLHLLSASGGLDPAGKYQPSQPPQTVAPVQPHQPGLCTNKSSLDHGLGAGCLWTILGSCGKSF